MIKLNLKRDHERRFYNGHPWVYSNELGQIPRNAEPGEPAELLDCHGNFLARGYFNAHSLISFRVVSRDQKIENPLSAEALAKKIAAAYELRKKSGYQGMSHRLVFGEADSLPGLVIDCFRCEDNQVFVLQAHTAGIDKALPEIEKALESYVKDVFSKQGGLSWSKTAVIINNNISVRTLEGLQVQEVRIARHVAGVDFKNFHFLVKAASPQNSKPLTLTTNLLEGQKTGFFFDQFYNIALVNNLFNSKQAFDTKTIRVLDLFSYVGQWGAQLSAHFVSLGYKVEITAVDASKVALEIAKKNIEAAGGTCKTMCLDILKKLTDLEKNKFDIVICDPPALIKKRKDIPVGIKAYTKINAQALTLAKPNGVYVACSCSALLNEESFSQLLAKAVSKSERCLQIIGQGHQAADHPTLFSFPEGKYLKCWVGIVGSLA